MPRRARPFRLSPSLLALALVLTLGLGPNAWGGGLSIVPAGSPSESSSSSDLDQSAIVGCKVDASLPGHPGIGRPNDETTVYVPGLCGGRQTYTYRCTGKLFYPDETWGSWGEIGHVDTRAVCGCDSNTVSAGTVRTTVLASGVCSGSLVRTSVCRAGTRASYGAWSTSQSDTRDNTSCLSGGGGGGGGDGQGSDADGGGGDCGDGDGDSGGGGSGDGAGGDCS